MQRALGKLEFQVGAGEGNSELPYAWKYSFRLLGIILDGHWISEEHLREMRLKANRRLSVLRREANSMWGFGNRIVPVTSHALSGSVVNFGLAAYGTHCSQQQADRVDSALRRKAARKITGTSTSVRREMVHGLADTKSFSGHFLRKSANVVDRAHRATGTRAQAKRIAYITRTKGFPIYTLDMEKSSRWMRVPSRVTPPPKYKLWPEWHRACIGKLAPGMLRKFVQR